jgi:hypothetical protein
MTRPVICEQCRNQNGTIFRDGISTGNLALPDHYVASSPLDEGSDTCDPWIPIFLSRVDSLLSPGVPLLSPGVPLLLPQGFPAGVSKFLCWIPTNDCRVHAGGDFYNDRASIFTFQASLPRKIDLARTLTQWLISPSVRSASEQLASHPGSLVVLTAAKPDQ